MSNDKEGLYFATLTIKPSTTKEISKLMVHVINNITFVYVLAVYSKQPILVLAVEWF